MTTHREALEVALNYIFTMRLTYDDIALTTFPAYWAGPLYISILPQFHLGGTVVVLKEFNPQVALELIEKEKVTNLLLASPLLVSLLGYPQLSKYDFKSLRCVIIAGSPTPEEVLKQAITTFGNIFIHVYGQIEQTPLTYLPAKEWVKRPLSCGKEALNARVRVVNEEGQDVHPGEVGEVISQGDNRTKGYWKLPEVTAETLVGRLRYQATTESRW